jgi:hypothetical protein
MAVKPLPLLLCVLISCLAQAQELMILQDSLTFGGLFRQIEEQTPYTVAYSHAILDPARKIPIPPSFGNIHLEEALASLFGETPYSYTIEGNHIIILPAAKGRPGFRREWAQGRSEGVFAFKGKVADSQSGEGLEYASVALLDESNRILSAGITNQAGEFSLRASRLPSRITISFLGYETLVEEMSGAGENLGAFGMDASGLHLEGITVTGKPAPSPIDRTVYPVTPQMREGTFDAADLLDKINGIYFDKSTQTFQLNNQSDILLLLDGMKQSPAYIRNLSSRQIRAIEVIREPSGRFLSEGYGVIVNLIPEDEARGYDVFVSDVSAAKLSGGRAKDWLANEQPAAGLSFTNPKMSLYATGLYNRERWNMPMTRELTYEGVRIPFADPNDAYRSQNFTSGLGINYRPDPNHVLALHAGYTAGNLYAEYVYLTERNVLSNISNRTLKNRAENLTINHILSGQLAYRGRINNRLSLDASLSGNYYGNDMNSRYGWSDDVRSAYINENVYNEYKRHLLFNAEASWLLSPRTSVNAGYSNSLRRYASESSHGQGFFDYRELRHIAFAYLSSAPSGRLHIQSGLGVEAVRIRNRTSEKRLLRLLPRLHIGYKASDALHVELNYAAMSLYPVMYQLSPMSISVDSFLSQVGNPDLLPSLRHTASLRLGWKDRLIVEPAVFLTQDGLSESYFKSDYKLYRSFRNIRTAEYLVYGAYSQDAGPNLRLAGSLSFYHAQASAEGIRNAVNGWLAHAEVRYYHPGVQAGMLLGFYRNMKEHVLWKGYQTLGKDNYLLEINKIFPRLGLSLALSWMPPLAPGIRGEQIKRVDTPLYSETTHIRLDAYRNMLLLRLSFRFNTGRKPMIDLNKQ